MAVYCAGCSDPLYAYRGTGVLQATGSTSAELASISVGVSTCVGDPEADPPKETFTTLTVGARCTVIGDGNIEMFRPQVGTPCSLAFSDGVRTLRVTDVVARHGVINAEGGKVYGDASYIELQLGGDDTKNGQHALYHFTGRIAAIQRNDLGFPYPVTTSSSRARVAATKNSLRSCSSTVVFMGGHDYRMPTRHARPGGRGGSVLVSGPDAPAARNEICASER